MSFLTPRCPRGLYNGVELDLSTHDFIATVDVFGSQSQTGGTSIKIGTYTIFDFTREKLGRSTVLHLPESDFRYLHFRVDGPLKPEDVTGLNLSRSAESKVRYITAAEGAQVIEKNRETLIEFSLPPNVPVDRVEFVPQAQPVNFSRDVTVTVTPQTSGRAGEGGEAGPSTSYGSILRLHGVHNGHQIDEERLSVDPPVSATSDATEWVMKIDNGDDTPLATPVRPVGDARTHSLLRRDTRSKLRRLLRRSGACRSALRLRHAIHAGSERSPRGTRSGKG